MEATPAHFDLVTVDPSSLDANAAVVSRSFGRATVTGPAVVLTVAGL
jgi:hypothetical protein